MSIQIGQKAPLFELPSTSGDTFNLETRIGKYTVLYFYPKDFTYGCTKEACSFRDEFSSFRDLGIDVYGINKDDMSTHKRFKSQLELPFDLLCDSDLKVAKKYNAVVPFIGMVKRVTYLLDPELRIVGSYDSMTGFDKHVRKILALTKS